MRFIRLNQPALPALVSLAQTALTSSVLEEKLLFTKEYFDMLDAQDEQDT